MGKPGRRLVVEAKPLTSDEEDEIFCQELWDKYCEYRTEEVLLGLFCHHIGLFFYF